MPVLSYCTNPDLCRFHRVLFVDPLGYRAWKNLLGYTGVLQGVSGISWSSQSGFLIVFAKKSKTGAGIFWAPFLPKDEQNNCQWEEILRMSCFIVLTTILLSYKENGPWSSRISRLWSINISGKTTFHVELVLKYSWTWPLTGSTVDGIIQ